MLGIVVELHECIFLLGLLAWGLSLTGLLLRDVLNEAMELLSLLFERCITDSLSRCRGLKLGTLEGNHCGDHHKPGSCGYHHRGVWKTTCVPC